MEISCCPHCQGNALWEGNLLGGGEIGNLPAGTFAPRNLKSLQWKAGVEIPNAYTLCLDSGLLWQILPQKKRAETRDYIAAYRK
jgi:Zn-finger nucleic acid-binding protein